MLIYYLCHPLIPFSRLKLNLSYVFQTSKMFAVNSTNVFITMVSVTVSGMQEASSKIFSKNE